MKPTRWALVLLALSFSVVHADEPSFDELPPLVQAHRIRNTGIGLAVVGTVSLLSGALLVWHASRPTDSDGVINENIAGYTLLAAGAASLYASIPLLVVGEVRARRAERATLQFSAGGALVRF